MNTATANNILTLVGHDEHAADRKHSTEYDVTSILKQLGVRTKFIGYKYLKTAITLCYENPDEYSTLVTKCLYPDIAKMYRVSTGSVEKALRGVISDIRCADDVKEKIIGYVSDTYTSKEFINSVAEYMRYL